MPAVMYKVPDPCRCYSGKNLQTIPSLFPIFSTSTNQKYMNFIVLLLVHEERYNENGNFTGLYFDDSSPYFSG